MNFRNKLALFIAILGLTSLVAGSSYAILSTNIKDEGTQLVTAGNVDLEIIEKTEGLDLSNITVMSDIDGMLQNNYYEFNLKNLSSTTVGYILSIIDDATALSSYTGNILDDSYIKVGLEVNNHKIGPYKLDEISRVLYDSYLLVGGKANFKLRFWLDESKVVEITDMKGYSTFFKVKVAATQYFEEEAEYVEANAPSMENNMIALAYDEESHNWYKADKDNTDNAWYNYQESIWANAATVKKTSSSTTLTKLDGTTSNCSNGTCTRNDYLNADIGTIIPMDDINTMWVWIPRFKYTIFNYNEDGKQSAESQQIKVVFEEGLSSTGTVTCEEYFSNGYSEKCSDSKFGAVTNGFSTYTHPAFTFGDKPITGFWMGKFEMSQNQTDSSIEIKPDVIAIDGESISKFFELSRSMELMNNAYGFKSNALGYTVTGELTNDDNKIDTHMIKNMEWGATAYLSQSKYGRCGNDACEDIYTNNSSYRYTGMSSGATAPNVKTLKEIYPEYDVESEYDNVITSKGYYSYDGKWSGSFGLATEYQEDLTLGYKASTTGNIYGIYDMSGGLQEIVMINMRKSSDISFNPAYSEDWTTDLHPLKKYYDEYAASSSVRLEPAGKVSKLGDAFKETRYYSEAHNNYVNWYDAVGYTGEGLSNNCFASRGGNANEMVSTYGNAGLFNSMYYNGQANNMYTTRVALIVENTNY